MSRQLQKSLYIDALALVPEKKSGVGLTLQQTLGQLTSLQEIKSWRIYLVVPLGKAKYIKRYTTASNIQIKTIWLPARAIEVLMRTRLLPPVDWFLGKGIYIFPNYRNWPVWRSRSLTYIYDTSFVNYPHTVQVKNQKYLSRYIKMWTGRTDKVITISSQVKSEIEQSLDVHYSKIDIVPCGVDSNLFTRRDNKDVVEAKQNYGINYDKYLLYVGNIEPRKNLIALLDAYALLPAKIQDEYGLVIVGGGGWLNEEFFVRLESMRQEGLKVIKVDKFVKDEDLPSIYSGAAALVHPAIYEGFGITPLEAMACGTPVAVSDLPVIREVVGAAGTYFDPNHSPSIKDAIVNIVSDKTATAKKINLGLSLAKDQSWQKSAAALHQTIEQEFSRGAHAHPLLSRLRTNYQRVNRLIMRLLGEKHYPAYRPPQTADITELRLRLYDDFLAEQPSRIQATGLKIYLGSKHMAAQFARIVYYKLRGDK